MIENVTKHINSFLSALKTTFRQQGQIGKILVPGLFVLLFCCLCSSLTSLFSLGSRNASTPMPSPNVLPSEGTGATPTALFNFATLTPFAIPTLPTSTPLPTLTPLPTGTETPTQILPTGTATSIPAITATQIPATATNSGYVVILTVDKPAEYVEIQNASNAPIDLSGWNLLSETGSQSCTLRGILQPNEVLRVWSGKGDSGISCGYSFNIWNDNQADPAVLYNPQGEEVSRYPK